MEAKDESFGFDFSGVYNSVEDNQYIEYTLDDARKVKIHFEAGEGETKIVETFEPENTFPVESRTDYY